jgi:hypothetical protein
VWFEQCGCPGSEAWRESRRRINAEMDEHERRHREVMQSIDVGRGKSADEIRQMILDEYAARGCAPPTEFGWTSGSSLPRLRVMAGLRGFSETARGLRAAKKWLRRRASPPSLTRLLGCPAFAHDA